MSAPFPWLCRTCCNIVTLCRKVLSPEAFLGLTGRLVSAGTERMARGYFVGLGRRFSESDPPDPQQVASERWAAFERAWERLSEGGVPLRPSDEAWEHYAAQRHKWDVSSTSLRQQFGYPTCDDAGRDLGQHSR